LVEKFQKKQHVLFVQKYFLFSFLSALLFILIYLLFEKIGKYKRHKKDLVLRKPGHPFIHKQHKKYIIINFYDDIKYIFPKDILIILIFNYKNLL
jgi:hypothetical protein